MSVLPVPQNKTLTHKIHLKHPSILTRAGICCQTPTTHMINICEPLQVISVKVQVNHSLMMDPL